MATKDPNRLFDLLDALRTNMESIIEDAKALATEAGGFNGELNKVIKEQVTKYLVPAIEKLINDDKTPGSIIGLERFLGSVPLAMVREQPTEADVPSDIMPDDVKLANPVGTTGDAKIDAIPQGASFNHPEGTGIKEALGRPDEPIRREPDEWDELHQYALKYGEHSVLRAFFKFALNRQGELLRAFIEAVKSGRIEFEVLDSRKFGEAQAGKETKFDGKAWKTAGDSKEPMETAEIDYDMQDTHADDKKYLQEKFQVVRTSKIGSALPDGKTGLKEQVVADFDTKEEAEEYAESLNKTITEGEKDLLGTEYKVTGCNGCGKVKESEGRSMKDVLDAEIAAMNEEPIREATGRSMKDVLDAEIAAREGKAPIRESGRGMKEVLDAEIEAMNAREQESVKKNS